jgi:hypothetical protein
VSFEPKAGLVVRYDFLWKEEQQAGVDSGKDRPCAIVLTSSERPDGSKDVLLCAITHTPPGKGETAIKVPVGVAKHLGLDEGQSWIKTDQLNKLVWEKGRIPHGISPARKGEWAFGMIPQGLGKQVFDQVREKARSRSLETIQRDESPMDWNAKTVDKPRQIRSSPPRQPDKKRDR